MIIDEATTADGEIIMRQNIMFALLVKRMATVIIMFLISRDATEIW